MSDKTPDLIELGAIANAHGTKGDVLIKPFGDPLALNQYGPLKDKTGQKHFTIEKMRANSKGLLIATVKEITDRNQAEALKGTLLCIDRSQLPDPQEDEFYYQDLIGLEARLENGTPFGRVINLADFGAGDLIELMPQNSQKSMYLSFTKENVPSLNIADGYIVISLPDEIELRDQKQMTKDNNQT